MQCIFCHVQVLSVLYLTFLPGFSFSFSLALTLFLLSVLRFKLACAKRQNVERILWIMNWIALMKDRKILFVFHAVAYFYHFTGNAHTIQTTTRYYFFVCVSLSLLLVLPFNLSLVFTFSYSTIWDVNNQWQLIKMVPTHG